MVSVVAVLGHYGRVLSSQARISHSKLRRRCMFPSRQRTARWMHDVELVYSSRTFGFNLGWKPGGGKVGVGAEGYCDSSCRSTQPEYSVEKTSQWKMCPNYMSSETVLPRTKRPESTCKSRLLFDNLFDCNGTRNQNIERIHK